VAGAIAPDDQPRERLLLMLRFRRRRRRRRLGLESESLELRPAGLESAGRRAAKKPDVIGTVLHVG
jgi:hypothetical protein